MKRSLIILLCALVCFGAKAQEIEVSVVSGLREGALKTHIEKNLTALLTAFNVAGDNGGNPDFSSIDISEDAADAVMMLWRNMRFTCSEPEIVERILSTYQGYQMRNIPVDIATDSGDTDYQELVIDMEKSGRISRVNFSLQSHLYSKIITEGNEVADLRCRQMILDYVEQFRTAYNRKDIDFLESVFSDDALIITGKVVKRKKGDNVAVLKNNTDIVYTQQTKQEYIEKLRTKVFPAAKYIKVTFSDIKVTKHPSVEGYYGVMLKQGYQSSNYSDEGYLFMIWDFRNEDHPQIHVRTWQPYWLDSAKTEKLEESKVFNINNFTIQ